MNRRNVSAPVVLGLVFALLGPAAVPPASGAVDPSRIRLVLKLVKSGLVQPTAMAIPDDGSGRIFVLERRGLIRLITPGGVLRRTPYLDLRSRVNDGGSEQGLLGLAFHPDFRDNGRFFVHFTDAQGDLRISRFAVDPTDNSVTGATEVRVLEIPHPNFTNHNGGAIHFGPRDGDLYVANGDGGGAGDPPANAQDKHSLLGKILRIDVDAVCGDNNYCSPPDNPFAGGISGADEIWHMGLRNPWRFSFDVRGNMWIGDVGQRAQEEIDLATVPAGARNFGWDCREGTLNTEDLYGGSYCDDAGPFHGPLLHYRLHVNGRCAVVGGYRYRGRAVPLLDGVYLLADFCTGEFWGVSRRQVNGVYRWLVAKVYDHSSFISSFGETPNGRYIYALDYAGRLYRVYAQRR